MFDKRLMNIYPESKKYIAGNVVFQSMEMILNAAMIFSVTKILERLYLQTIVPKEMAAFTAVIILTIILRVFTTKAVAEMNFLASRTVKKRLREMIYMKLLKLGKAYRNKVSTSELVQESVEGVEQLETYFGLYVPQFFYALIAPIILFILFCINGSWRVGIVLLICVPLIPLAIIMVQKVAKKLLSRYWNQYTELGSSFLENLQGMTTLKIYQADRYKNEKMNEESEYFRKVTMAVLTMQLNSIIVMDFIAYGGAAIGIILAGGLFLRGEIALGSCLFMILLSAEFFLPMRKLGSYFHVAMNGMAASDKIFQFLSEDEPKDKKEIVSGTDIELREVSFSYDGAKNALDNINIRIPKGRFIGIVGESGSGKSTVASLITGRNHPAAGEIEIGGKRIDDISENSLSKAITYVGFGSVFFKGTVRDNLVIANQGVTEEQMWKALEECKMSDFLRDNNGLDTLLCENASNLSGGQKQRLALVRAMLHDSPVYIFDEATSNIDMESEEDILEQIRRLAKEKTVIMITHRLANVTAADRIYCMEQGRISEDGTHEKLLAQNGRYAALWNTQIALERYGLEAV